MAVPVAPELDPILRSLEVLRSRSGFLVMREAFYGTRRFDDFARRLDLSPSSLAVRLRALEAEGLLDRVPYKEPGARVRHEYALTAKGEALLPALVALLRWGNDHLSDGAPAVDLVHDGCGAALHSVVQCAQGHPVPLADARPIHPG